MYMRGTGFVLGGFKVKVKEEELGEGRRKRDGIFVLANITEEAFLGQTPVVVVVPWCV